MASLGLRQPITVARKPRSEGPGFYVIVGAHRLEAARKLGWSTIPCYVENLSATDARLWEISENLHRAELSVGERSDQIAEWVRLTTDKPDQVEQVSKGGRGKESGVAKASRDLGIDRSEVNRSVRIASITPEAREAARAVGLDDNQSALLKVASAPSEKQVETVEKIVKAKAPKAAKDPRAKNEREAAEIILRHVPSNEIELLLRLMARLAARPAPQRRPTSR